MQILPLLVAIALGILALAFVLYPLYRRPGLQMVPAEASAAPQRSNREQAEETDQTVLAERTARDALQEVELDFQLGNLAESDYHALRDRYMRRAYAAAKARSRGATSVDEPDEVGAGGLGAHEDTPDIHEIDEAIEIALSKMKEEKVQREAQQ